MPEITRPQLVAYALAAVVVVVLGVRFMHAQQGRADGPEGAAAAPRPGAPDGAAAGTVRIERERGTSQLVHVAGAVRRPGVYRLPAGARVQEAVRRAGGARPGADVNAINLAAKVADGQQVVVPARAPRATGTSAAAGTPGAGTAAGAGAAPGAPVSLNSATAEQLDTLDGVGPATADKIIQWRTQNGGFRSVEDLAQVPGIGPKRMAALRERVQP